MGWFANLDGKWQRVLIAVVVVLLLVSTEVLREMVKTEEANPESERSGVPISVQHHSA